MNLMEKKNSPKILLSFFNAHWVNYKKKKRLKVLENIAQ